MPRKSGKTLDQADKVYIQTKQAVSHIKHFTFTEGFQISNSGYFL